jgi:aspartate/methionine/tyrosine aminotransferase
MAYPRLLTRWAVRLGLAQWLPGVRQRLDGATAVLHHFSDRLLTAPLADLGRAGEALQQHGPEVVDLTPGAPLFDLAPSGTSKLPADRRGWPPVGGFLELRGAVADRLHEGSGLDVDPHEEVLITAGAHGAVQTICDAFVNRGERVVMPDPCSPLFPLTMRAQGARVRWLTTWVDEGRLRFCPVDLDRALRGARLLILNSPANPTGAVIAPEDLERIAHLAARHDVLILNDESFERYRYESDLLSIGSLAAARERTLTVGSMSKGHALASARVGWIAGPRYLLRGCAAAAAMRTPFVPTLAQQVALTALRTGRTVFAPILDGFMARRHYATERLRGLGCNVGWPSGGFFLWVPVWQLGVSGRTFTENLLQERRVLVTPGDLFGPSGIGYVRISFATEDGRLREGLNRIAAFLQKLPQSTAPEMSRAAA